MRGSRPGRGGSRRPTLPACSTTILQYYNTTLPARSLALPHSTSQPVLQLLLHSTLLSATQLHLAAPLRTTQLCKPTPASLAVADNTLAGGAGSTRMSRTSCAMPPPVTKLPPWCSTQYHRMHCISRSAHLTHCCSKMALKKYKLHILHSHANLYQITKQASEPPVKLVLVHRLVPVLVLAGLALLAVCTIVSPHKACIKPTSNPLH